MNDSLRKLLNDSQHKSVAESNLALLNVSRTRTIFRIWFVTVGGRFDVREAPKFGEEHLVLVAAIMPICDQTLATIQLHDQGYDIRVGEYRATEFVIEHKLYHELLRKQQDQMLSLKRDIDVREVSSTSLEVLALFDISHALGACETCPAEERDTIAAQFKEEVLCTETELGSIIKQSTPQDHKKQ